MTNTTEKTFLFDPGYAQHTTILSINIEYMYSMIAQFKNLGQRRTQFKMFYPKILKMVESNIGFCLGSLLWAAYIKSDSENAKIEGNPCLGGEYDEAEAVEEIDFSIDYFTQLKKDAKYYLSTNYEINPLYIKILKLYKEFLTQNRGFVDTKTTSDLQIPTSMTIPDKDAAQTIYNKIQNVITSGKLIELTEVFGLIYKG
ncbi:MAG: hypothetical protein NC191_05065 [Muribaculaceae bacterium]|nr:hypothetical protein [Muribaculaceae bacterium]